MSVVTRWRKIFSSTTTQFNLMSGFSASTLGERVFRSIIAGLFTVAMVTVFCWARALKPVKRTTRKGKSKRVVLFIWISCDLLTIAGAPRQLGVPAGRKWSELALVNGVMEVKCLCRRWLACGLISRTPRRRWKTNVALRFGKLFGVGRLHLCKRC